MEMPLLEPLPIVYAAFYLSHTVSSSIHCPIEGAHNFRNEIFFPFPSVSNDTPVDLHRGQLVPTWAPPTELDF